MRRDPRLEIITETIERLIPGAVPANLTVRILENLPNGLNTWDAPPAGLAERIFTALYGRPKTTDDASPARAGNVPLRRTEALKIITRVLRQPVENVTAADLISGHPVASFDPAATERPQPWAMQVDMLALRIAGQLPLTDDRSPLAQAEDAKHARDLEGEIGALMSAGASLESAPWYPVRRGDVVCVHYEQAGDFPPFGETYIVGDAGDGLLDLKLLAHSLPEGSDAERMVGCFAVEAMDCPIYDLWFEAGPQRLTIVRDGRVIHRGESR